MITWRLPSINYKLSQRQSVENRRLRLNAKREQVKFPDGEAGNAGKGLPEHCLASIGGTQNTKFRIRRREVEERERKRNREIQRQKGSRSSDHFIQVSMMSCGELAFRVCACILHSAHGTEPHIESHLIRNILRNTVEEIQVCCLIWTMECTLSLPYL